MKNDSIQPKENSKTTDFRPIKSRICKEQGCTKRRLFNIKGETKAIYCFQHKKDDMVDVLNKSCIYKFCNKRPNFNIDGEKKALYCCQHKQPEMINVLSKKCIHDYCNTLPMYNVKGQKALYCSQHKLDGMIDIMHKTCIYQNCIVRPNYNIEGQTKGLYCSEHKLEGMIDVLSKKCIFPDCKRQPSYNVEGQKRLYCSEHKKDEMINVIQKTCKTYLCSSQVKEKYDGYCLFCYMHLFPDKPVSRNYKTKEYAVVEFVKNKFPDLSWIADKKVNGGCSKRRPDLLLDLGYQIVIIEVDENQHIDYDCSCQNKRIMELSQDLGHRPIIFIRFNPDDYKTDGKNITSCWGQNKKGICVVKKIKNNEWSERLNVLEQHINYWINPSNVTNKTIEIIQLYYDN